MYSRLLIARLLIAQAELNFCKVEIQRDFVLDMFGDSVSNAVVSSKP